MSAASTRVFLPRSPPAAAGRTLAGVVASALFLALSPLLARAGDPVSPDPDREAALATWTARVEAARRDYESFARAAVEGRAARAGAIHVRPAPASGTIGDFLADGTLRPGDVVVTDKGFLVFTGGSGAISEDDFAPVVTIRRDRERETLRDLERASGFPAAASP